MKLINPQKLFFGLIGWSKFMLETYKPVHRITKLVRDYPEFFEAGIGDPCMEKAADKLEKIINEWRAENEK